MGLQFKSDFANNNPTAGFDEYHGIVTTYQAICSNPDYYLKLFARYRVYAVLDEPHHLGDDPDQSMRWCEAIKRALGGAYRRLLMTGTPDRTDNRQMPFTRLDMENKYVFDFRYTYTEAIQDGVCRPVEFHREDGKMEWRHRDEPHIHEFTDEISQERSRQRLRTALKRQEWVESILSRATERLGYLRREIDPSAGCLIAAMDQDHARDVVVPAIKKITGVMPRIAISDDPKALGVINAFRESRDPYLVTVRMVSEGIDIDRLRVGVYLTNIQTATYVSQFVGRVIRMDKEDEWAFIYIPNDPVLHELVLEIEDSVTRAIVTPIPPDGTGPSVPSGASTYEPVSAEPSYGGVTTRGEDIDGGYWWTSR